MKNIASFFLTDLLSVLAGFSIIRYQPEMSPLLLGVILAVALNFYRLVVAELMDRFNKTNDDTTLAWILFIVVDVFVLIAITFLLNGATTLTLGQAAILRMVYLGVLMFNYLNEVTFLQEMVHQLKREMVDDTTGE